MHLQNIYKSIYTEGVNGKLKGKSGIIGYVVPMLCSLFVLDLDSMDNVRSSLRQASHVSLLGASFLKISPFLHLKRFQ